jgi:diguanylate cyclase (GGDEF)-like protein/PAS domain S-box-containing protein
VIVESHLTFCRIVIFLYVVLHSTTLFSAPLIAEPKFSKISTEHGLSQDTVNAMLIDKQGFLWIGTEGGLNRYDGYTFEQITGTNNDIEEIGVYALFQDAQENIWISTDVAGVFILDLDSKKTQRVGDWRYKLQPQWYQSASQFLQDESGAVWITLEQKVISKNGLTETTWFEISDELINEEHLIRQIWLDNEILLVGTTDGLYAVNRETKESAKLDHLGRSASSPDVNNIKLLNVSKDTLWIGTVEGLFSMPFAELKEYFLHKGAAPSSSLRIPDLNIWEMLAVSDEQYYLATNKGLYTFQAEGDQLQYMFQLTDSRYYLSDDNIISMLSDDYGNLWLGTRHDGALHWSPRSTRFTNVFNHTGKPNEFSNNEIWSLYQQDDYRLWVGTSNGLNRYDLITGEVESYLVSQQQKSTSAGSLIQQILPAGNDNLWLLGADGITKFDTLTGKVVALDGFPEQSRALLNGFAIGASIDKQSNLWFVTNYGVYQLGKDNKISKLDTSNYFDSSSVVERIFGDVEGFPNSILIASIGQLSSYNTVTKEFTGIHQLPDDVSQRFVAPDSFVIDDNGVMWISYPGKGLYGIDAKTYAPLYHFNRNNLLPSNSIYGLQLDATGNIWMSSHHGLLKFYPENQHIQRFTYAEGLIASEFNQGSNVKLADGRLIYGSPKGITIFDPAKMVNPKDGRYRVVISELSVSTKGFEMPLSNLDGQAIELDYDDVGITISFTTLAYEDQNSTRYSYQLTGGNNLTYPATRDPEVIIPKLDPGDYVFNVTAYDPNTGQRSEAASVGIKVNYALWASPLAYAAYLLLLISSLVLWWQTRRRRAKQIMRAHEQALDSKNRLSLALTASNSNVWEYHATTDTLYAPRVSDELGYLNVDITLPFTKHLSLIHPHDRSLYETRWQSFIDNKEASFDITYRMQTKSDKWLWYRDVGSVVSDSVKSTHLVVAGTYSNITESLANIEKVRLFGEAFKHTRDWVVIFDKEYRPIAVNQALCEVFSIDEYGDLDSQFTDVLELNSDHAPRFWQKIKELNITQHWKGEEELVLHNGKVCNVLINMTSIASVRHQEEVDYYLMIMSDISEQKEAEKGLRHLANFDGLTNLPNRTLLLDRVKHAIDHATRHKTVVGLFFIDLDRFKQVNDSLGHDAGDELLVAIAMRLTNLLRNDDTVARLGGDEFVVMVENVQQAEKLSVLAQQIITVLEAPVQLGNQTVSVSSSIGIALFPNDANASEDLLRNADLAMYHAKEQGRSNFQYFTEHMNKQAQARLVLENQLKKAHQIKGFVNYYQPIVNIKNGMVEGFELLMRWPTSDGMVPPDQFIPIAEELGLIEDMTWDALERAMPTLVSWLEKGREVYLSVNLSARHFERQISIEHITQLLHRYNLPVSALRFEITESALMRDYKRALEYMESMRKYGFVIALDDFGTGYSSLKYLKEFPIQVLKVDKSFVDDIGKNKSNEALVITTLRMADSLGMYCVAEGIEEQIQIDFFKHHGCDFLQGYFFSKPVPSDQTQALLVNTWPV